MNTTTNHGAAIPLPRRQFGKSEAIQKALRAYRNSHTGHIYVVWAQDVENAVIDEERIRHHMSMNEPIELEGLADGAVKARGVTFISDRRLPRGVVYIMSYDPRYALDNRHVADQTMLDAIGNLADTVIYP
jgi:hypothetical protein